VCLLCELIRYFFFWFDHTIPVTCRPNLRGTKEITNETARLLLHFVRLRLVRLRILRFILTVPISLHRWSRSPDVGASQEVLGQPGHTHAPLLLPLLHHFLDPRPHHGFHLTTRFPLVTVLEEVVSRLVITTIVLQVAPPALVD